MLPPRRGFVPPALLRVQRPDMASLVRLQPWNGQPELSIRSRFCRVLGTPGELIVVARMMMKTLQQCPFHSPSPTATSH